MVFLFLWKNFHLYFPVQLSWNRPLNSTRKIIPFIFLSHWVNSSQRSSRHEFVSSPLTFSVMQRQFVLIFSSHQTISWIFLTVAIPWSYSAEASRRCVFFSFRTIPVGLCIKSTCWILSNGVRYFRKDKSLSEYTDGKLSKRIKSSSFTNCIENFMIYFLSSQSIFKF
jgi:hypothetical protein